MEGGFPDAAAGLGLLSRSLLGASWLDEHSYWWRCYYILSGMPQMRYSPAVLAVATVVRGPRYARPLLKVVPNVGIHVVEVPPRHHM